jgi:hypothetical protein
MYHTHDLGIIPSSLLVVLRQVVIVALVRNGEMAATVILGGLVLKRSQIIFPIIISVQNQLQPSSLRER